MKIQEEQQQENSLIIKQFEELNIPIYGTYEEPLFKAKDIGELLDLKNIRESIKNYNSKQKCEYSLTDAIGRNQNTTFLTEQGLYKVLMKSKKPIAEKFQDWVCQVIQEIRLTGEYKNKKSIENETKSTTLIQHFTDKRIVYLGVVKELEDYTIVKYGCTKMIKDTLNRHRNTYGSNFYFIYMTECEKHDELERSIQTHSDLTNRHIKEYDGNQRNELIKIDKEYDSNKLINLIETMKNAMNSIPLELLLLKELTKQKEIETKQKELDNVKFIEETKQKEIQVNLEIRKLELEYQLELRKLELQIQVQPIINVPLPCPVKEYIEKCTIYSNDRNHTIKMSDLYKNFVIWLKIKYPNGIFSSREFTGTFRKVNINNSLGLYDLKISNLSGNSGIRYRKMKS